MEYKWFLVFAAFIMFGAFGGMALEQHNLHECRMEAIKALQDPKMIKEICGD